MSCFCILRMHRACRRWWSRLLQIHCHRSSPLQCCSQTLGHRAFQACRPAWCPATPPQWHTWTSDRDQHKSGSITFKGILFIILGSTTDLNSRSTAWGNVWKLLFLLICVPSTMAIFPNTWTKANFQFQFSLNSQDLKNMFCLVGSPTCMPMTA